MHSVIFSLFVSLALASNGYNPKCRYNQCARLIQNAQIASCASIFPASTLSLGLTTQTTTQTTIISETVTTVLYPDATTTSTFQATTTLSPTITVTETQTVPSTALETISASVTQTDIIATNVFVTSTVFTWDPAVSTGFRKRDVAPAENTASVLAWLDGKYANPLPHKLAVPTPAPAVKVKRIACSVKCNEPSTISSACACLGYTTSTVTSAGSTSFITTAVSSTATSTLSITSSGVLTASVTFTSTIIAPDSSVTSVVTATSGVTTILSTSTTSITVTTISTNTVFAATTTASCDILKFEIATPANVSGLVAVDNVGDIVAVKSGIAGGTPYRIDTANGNHLKSLTGNVAFYDLYYDPEASMFLQDPDFAAPSVSAGQFKYISCSVDTSGAGPAYPFTCNAGVERSLQLFNPIFQTLNLATAPVDGEIAVTYNAYMACGQ